MKGDFCVYWILLIISLTLNAGGNLLAKYAMKDAPSNIGILSLALYAIANWKIWLSVTCFGVAFVGYAVVLTKMDLSLAYPIMTTAGFLIIMFASFFLFSEQMSLLRVIGISLMIAGIWIISKT